MSKDVDGLHPRKNMALKVKAYALRFLKHSRSPGFCSQAEIPTTPDRIYESSTVDMSWEDHLTEVWANLPTKYLFSILI